MNNRRDENLDGYVSPICNKCRNFLSGDECLAFRAIPNLVIEGKNDHSKPLSGQENSVIFEPIEEDER